MAVRSSSRTKIDYPALFRTYVVKGTRQILRKVQRTEFPLTPEDRNRALHTLNFALKLPKAWPETRELLLTIAPKMEQSGHRDEWMPYLQQGIQLSQSQNDMETLAKLRLQLGLLYQMRGKYEEAHIQLEASVRDFKILKSSRYQALALNRLAYIARFQRQYEKAIHSIEIVRQLLGEEDVEWAYSCFVLSLIALDKRAWQETIDYSKQALSLWEQENNQRMIGRTLINLGAAMLPMKRFKEAIEVCQKAITIFEEIHDPIYRAIAQMHLGNVYVSLERTFEALELYRPAEKTFRQARDRLRLAHINHNIGLAYRQLQDWDKAKSAYLLSIEYQQKIGNIVWLVNTMDGLGLVYLEQDRPQKAISIFEEALNQLTQIKGEPGYEHLLKMVSNHLQEAFEQAIC